MQCPHCSVFGVFLQCCHVFFHRSPKVSGRGSFMQLGNYLVLHYPAPRASWCTCTPCSLAKHPGGQIPFLCLFVVVVVVVFLVFILIVSLLLHWAWQKHLTVQTLCSAAISWTKYQQVPTHASLMLHYNLTSVYTNQVCLCFLKFSFILLRKLMSFRCCFPAASLKVVRENSRCYLKSELEMKELHELE